MRVNKNILVKEMARKCLSVNELAELTGLGTTTIVKMKNGKGQPRTKTLGLIAKILDIDVEVLLLDD